MFPVAIPESLLKTILGIIDGEPENFSTIIRGRSSSDNNFPFGKIPEKKFDAKYLYNINCVI